LLNTFVLIKRISMQSHLTIVTITKDDLEGVASTLRSTCALRTFEWVSQIIIDGSIKAVSHKVRQLAVEEQVEYVWQEPDGIAQAFNLGLDHVRDGFVWFLNGKDEAHPDLNIPLLMQLLGSSKGDILVFELEFIATGVRYKRPPLWALWPPIFWMPHPATLVRRELYDTYGRFSPDFRIAMDGELWIRFLSNDIGIDMVSLPLARFDQSGVSSTDQSKMFIEIDRVIKENFRLLFRIWLRQGLYLYQSMWRRVAAKFLHRGGDH